MNTQQNMEERLWEYIDGTCSEEEKTFIARLVEENQEWRVKYQELLEVNQLLQQDLELEHPSMRFTRNVMEEIGKHQIAPAASSYINKRIIWGIISFFLLMITGFLIYTFGQVKWSDARNNPELPIDFGNIDLSKIEFSNLFNNSFTNVFLMISVVLGLMMLDMYLRKKKKELQQKQQHS